MSNTYKDLIIYVLLKYKYNRYPTSALFSTRNQTRGTTRLATRPTTSTSMRTRAVPSSNGLRMQRGSWPTPSATFQRTMKPSSTSWTSRRSSLRMSMTARVTSSSSTWLDRSSWTMLRWVLCHVNYLGIPNTCSLDHKNYAFFPVL